MFYIHESVSDVSGYFSGNKTFTFILFLLKLSKINEKQHFDLGFINHIVLKPEGYIDQKRRMHLFHYVKINQNQLLLL